MNKQAAAAKTEVALRVRVRKSQGRFTRIRNREGRDQGTGEFFLLLEITSLLDTVYIPASIASGKKPAGFVYQIEGTSRGTLSSADVSVDGLGVSQVTSGTIVYTKIPKGTTAAFRILVTMQGFVNESYGIVINKIHFKTNPSDARYQKYLNEIPSKVIRFQ